MREEEVITECDAILFAKIALVTACFALATRAPADLTAASSRKAAPDFTLSDHHNELRNEEATAVSLLLGTGTPLPQ